MQNDTAWQGPPTLWDKWYHAVQHLDIYGLSETALVYHKTHSSTGIFVFATGTVKREYMGIRLKYSLFTTTYRLEWANPMWYLTGHSPESHEGEVQQRLQQLIQDFREQRMALVH